MMKTEEGIQTRLGDGSLLRLTRSEMRADIEAGIEAAVKRAHVPPLTVDEADHLLDICASRARFSSVDLGSEVVLSIDGTGGQLVAGRQGDLLTFEQYLGADIVELYHMDYSFKAVKTVLPFERQTLKNAQQALTVPVQYGAMPDLGRYSRPDGPVANWSELLPLGRIAEARAAQEEAAEMAAHDIAFVAEGVWEAGADAHRPGHVGRGRRRRPAGRAHRHPGDPRPLPRHGHRDGHGERDGPRHARRAGVAGRPARRPLAAPAGQAGRGGGRHRVRTRRQRQLDEVAALEPGPHADAVQAVLRGVATIPVHMNVGMGVGGVPMAVRAPVDAVSRAARACVDILKVDGL